MFKSLFISALFLVTTGCATVPSENQSQKVSSYPQDIEQCMAQPDVIWCVKACEVDSTYDWCGENEDE